MGGGIWTQPAIDAELGLVYVNAANPMPPYDGSARVGKNLFTNSTIALDLETGAIRWYYQTIHHDIWDWDNITGPTLFDVTDANGETIKGVAAAGKNCLLYMWHRETGEPINPIVETRVETRTNVPGEVVYPTHRMTLFEGRDQIDLYHFGAGHTDGDTVVVFPALGTIHTGDLFAFLGPPYIDVNNGGSGVAYPETLEAIVAAFDDITRVIPGHIPLPSGSPIYGSVACRPSCSGWTTWEDLVQYAQFNRDFLAAGTAPRRRASV